jgi:plasmid rolling circle replication initiator protein Rep
MKAQKNAYLFNKLEQLRKSPFTNSLEVLNKRAKAKYSQEPLIEALINLNSPLKHQYINCQDCSSILNAQGDKLTSRYCGNRFCKICNRIRTGKLINGYGDQLLTLSDPQFLTLTIPNVSALDLRDTVKKMGKTIRKIQDNRRKANLPLITGVRKLECTYNTDLNNYHPHYHFIIDSELIANEVIEAWLNFYPNANIKAQKTVTATDCKELFKYFTKLTSKTGDQYKNGSKLIDAWHFPEAIDLIFQAIAHLRIIQPMGGLKMVKDDVEELQAIDLDETVKIEPGINLYNWHNDNWVDFTTGEQFTSFKPLKNLQYFRKKIRYLNGNTV